MFSRAIRNIFRGKLLKGQKQQKEILRTIFASRISYSQNHEEDIIVSNSLPSINYPDCTIDQFVFSRVNEWSHKIALVDGITERSVTYGELRDHCRAFAIRLNSVLRLNYGDVIAVCLPNSIEFPIAVLGGNEAGMIVTTVNPIYTAEEISRQLINSGARLIIGLSSLSNVLKEAAKLCPQPIRVVYVKESASDSLPADGVNFSDLIDFKNIDLNSLPTSNRDCDETAVIPYSSGTTGLPKGVLLSHKNVVSNAIMMNSDRGGGRLIFPAVGDHQDILPCVLPFFHIYGYNCTLVSKLAEGSKLITLPKFTPETFLTVLERHESTLLHLVPPIVIFMSNYDKVQLKHTNSIKYLMSGAAPLGASDVEKFHKIAPRTKVFQGYGLTESSPVALMSLPGSKNFGSAGRLMPDTEAKIVRVDDPRNLGVGPNVIGELWIRGPHIMKGYHENEKATKETITPDGWLRTGDISYYDENHEFFITDRLKELIKVKGFQVAPAELESLLREHEDITDAAVIGIPHPTAGELPRAYVIGKNPNLSEKDVQAFIAKKVSKHKWLESGVEFVESIPKNATGKILRRELKKQYGYA